MCLDVGHWFISWNPKHEHWKLLTFHQSRFVYRAAVWPWQIQLSITAASSPVDRPGKAFCNSDMQLFLLDKGCEFFHLNKKRANRFEAWYGIWYHHTDFIWPGMIPLWKKSAISKVIRKSSVYHCVSTNKLKKTVRLLDLSKRCQVDLQTAGQMWGTRTKPLQISYVLLLFFEHFHKWIGMDWASDSRFEKVFFIPHMVP